ncbi:uncharacterized protein isoform X2 [Rhodnius prolixus]
MMRRTIVRYACLSLTITLRMMCPTVKKRFPTIEHMVEAGLMLPNERKTFEILEEKTVHPKYWLPLVWAASIITRARREDRVKNDFALKTLIDEVNKFRSGCGSLLNYDWISVPLVYTQVVTLAVFTYFTASLMGNQYLNPQKGYPTHTIDLVVPIFTLLQFFFYMGWLMVAETLVNPFGEDDDDFEVNWLIDRNLQISYLIVDEVHEDHPALIKDQYWEEVFPTELPYTEAAKQYYIEPFLGSTQDVEVPLHQRGVILMPVNVDTEFSIRTIESGQTSPLPIKSIFSLKAKNNSFANAPRRTPSKSVLSMIRKNINEDYINLSRKKSVEVGGKTHNSLIVHKSQEYSENSTSRNNFNDFQEDIFRMSDFSMAESLEKSQPGVKTIATVIKRAKKKSTQENFSSAANEQENHGELTKNELNTKAVYSTCAIENAQGSNDLLPSTDVNSLVYFSNSEYKTVIANPSIRNHWKRDIPNTIIFNKSELYLDNYMSRFKKKLLENITNNDDIDKKTIQKDPTESSKELREHNEVVELDQQILLENELTIDQRTSRAATETNEIRIMPADSTEETVENINIIENAFCKNNPALHTNNQTNKQLKTPDDFCQINLH